MNYLFTYEGGPRHEETERTNASAFPMELDGGRYEWNGNSRGTGMGDDHGQFDKTMKATAVWVPTA